MFCVFVQRRRCAWGFDYCRVEADPIATSVLVSETRQAAHALRLVPFGCSIIRQPALFLFIPLVVVPEDSTASPHHYPPIRDELGRDGGGIPQNNHGPACVLVALALVLKSLVDADIGNVGSGEEGCGDAGATYSHSL